MPSGSDGHGALGRAIAVHGLDMHDDVRGTPVVIVGTAAACVEANDETLEIQREYKPAIAGAATGVELLGVELVLDAVVPDVGRRRTVVGHVRDREGVNGVGTVLVAGVVVESGHVARQADVAGVAVAATGAVVAAREAILDYLHILIAILLLPNLDVKGRSQFRPNLLEPGLGPGGAEEARRQHIVGRVFGITAVGYGNLAGHGGIKVFLVERARAGDARASRHGSVRVGIFDREASHVDKLEPICARRADLELVGVRARRFLRNGHVFVALACGKAERIRLRREVLRRVGAQSDGAVEHALRRIRLGARDDERVAGRGHGERGMAQHGNRPRLARTAAGTRADALLLAGRREGSGRRNRPRAPVVSERSEADIIPRQRHPRVHVIAVSVGVLQIGDVARLFARRRNGGDGGVFR